MIIHFLFNFFIGLISGNIIAILSYCAIFYSIVAVILIVINPGQSLYIKKGGLGVKSQINDM